MNMRFTNKKVIVTGANRSMGSAMAIAFAKEGADVVISYRSDEAGAHETVKAIQNLGRDGKALYAEFSQANNVAVFAEEAIAHLGHIDILINNAGMYYHEDFFNLSPEKLQEIFQINTIAPLHLSQLCAKDMVTHKIAGCIINISSIAGTTTFDRGIGYASSKSAMNKWTQNVALNLAEYRIRVNTIAPGVVAAGMNQNKVEKDKVFWEERIQRIPLQRAGTPEDITNMALFLASDEAQWITGKIYEVDGGDVL